MHMEMFKILIFCHFEKHYMTCTALHTNGILKYLVLDKTESYESRLGSNKHSKNIFSIRYNGLLNHYNDLLNHYNEILNRFNG